MATMTYGYNMVCAPKSTDRGAETRKDAKTLESLGFNSVEVCYILAHRYVPISYVKPSTVGLYMFCNIQPCEVITWPSEYGDYVKFDGEFFTVYNRE